MHLGNFTKKLTNKTKLLGTFILGLILLSSFTWSFPIFIAQSKTNYPFATWYWDDFANEDYSKKVVAAANRGVDTIYLNIESFDIAGIKPTYPIKSLLDYKEKLAEFINYANKANIKVEALLGNSEFSRPSNVSKVYQTVEFVVNYNKDTNLNKQNLLTGLHLDIEFYNDQEYVNNKVEFTKNYYDMIFKVNNDLTSYRDSSYKEFKFTQDVTYQSFNNLVIPTIQYKNKNTFFLDHISNLLNSSDYNYINLMSYRSKFEGVNSVSDISNQNIKFLNTIRSKLKVNIAIETADIGDSHVSLYGKNLKYIRKGADRLNKIYSKNPNFSGVSVHDINSLIKIN